MEKREIYSYHDKGAGERIAGFTQKQFYLRLVIYFQSKYKLDSIQAKKKAKGIMGISHVREIE